jgi:hypothetical protein
VFEPKALLATFAKKISPAALILSVLHTWNRKKKDCLLQPTTAED